MVKTIGLIILMFSGCCGLVAGPSSFQWAFGEAEKGFSELSEDRGNPFLTKKEEKAQVDMGNAIPLESLKVSAIFYSQLNSQNRVIIDGKVLVLGDNIDNKVIIKINPEDVILEDGQGQYVAKMAKLKVNAVSPE